MSKIQCTRVQFNEYPDVKNFTKEDDCDSQSSVEANDTLVETIPDKPKSVKAKRLSTCGLGTLAGIVSNDNEEEGDVTSNGDDLDTDDESSQSEAQTEVCNSTFTFSESNNANETFSISEPSECNSTFVIEKEDSVDDVISENALRLNWKPATPPKKRPNVDHTEGSLRFGKENNIAAALFPTPKKLLSKSSSVSKFPLKPSNSKIAKFYSPMK